MPRAGGVHLGVDLGTSALKVVLATDADEILDHESVALEVSRPGPLASEQDPEAWWCATTRALAELALARGLDPRPVSGRQEALENLVNRYR